jgi:TonB-dependent starch-binding outer membrane protein SusC
MSRIPIEWRRRIRSMLAASGLLGAIAVGAAVLLAPAPALAQEAGGIRGTVTQVGTGQPVVGAQVLLRGTTRGTLTDSRGAFLIPNVAAGQHTLRVESIGFRSVEQQVTVRAGETAAVEFELATSAIGLDEIVVTGTAGRTTLRALGNSVTRVDAAMVTEHAPVANIQQLLQGRSAGLVVLPSTGVVGGSSRMRVRGLSSLSAGNEPVVYIDGVRMFSGTSLTESNTAQGINRLESLNPNDIESIELIKGPAASTLYGADAAAGVLQIITKKGRGTQGLQWNANFEYGSIDWVKDQPVTYWLCTDANINNPNAFPGCRQFSVDQPLSERLLVDHPFDMGKRSSAVYQQLRDRGLPTDRWECLFPEQQPCNPAPLRSGSILSQNLSVRGGGEAFNFYISGERHREEGTFFNNHNHRTSARANFGFVPSARANFNVGVGYTRQDQQIPQSDNSSNSVLRNSYRGQAGGPNSQYLPGYRNMHPEFSNKHDRRQFIERVLLSMTGNYDPTSWWQNRLTVGMDRHERENRTFNQIDQTGLSPFGAIAATGRIQYAIPTVYRWTVDYAGTATANLREDLTSAFSAGMQYIKARTDTYELDGQGLVANKLNLVSGAAQRFGAQSFSEQISLGFYLQEQLGWRDRLFGTFAVRIDDNSAFGSDFSVVVYPKASLSYVISDEDYFNLPWVEELKLRGAWGQAGNAPSPFSADRTYSTARAVVNNDAVNRLQTASFGNPNLKAETGQEVELGFDASFLSGRMTTDFTFFFQQTKDALVQINSPPSSGWVGQYLTNIGEIRNHGVELTLDVTPISRRNLSWQTMLAAATLSNKLISFGKDAEGNPARDEVRFGPFIATQRHREGYPLGGFWRQDVLRDANGNVVLDADGRAIVPACTWPAQTPADCSEEFLGPMLPKYTFGLTNRITLLNNLTLYAFADYQGGHWKFCALCSVRTRIDLNTEQITNPDLTPEERARLLSLQTVDFITRSDFLKLRELSLTYAIPQRFTERAGFSRASVTASGRNLWMWTKYEGGGDPEVTFTSNDEFQSADYASVPMLRRLLISMNFSF